MLTSSQSINTAIAPGSLHRVHHNCFKCARSASFWSFLWNYPRPRYRQRSADSTAIACRAGKVTNFVTPDGTVLNLFWEPDLPLQDTDLHCAFTKSTQLPKGTSGRLFTQECLVYGRFHMIYGQCVRKRSLGVDLGGQFQLKLKMSSQ